MPSNATELLIWQYRDKPKAVATIQALADEFDNVTNAGIQLMDAFAVRTAVGFFLDIVGRRVGVDRYLAVPLADGTTKLDDETYRTLILAVIAKWWWREGTVEELTEAIEFLLPGNPVIVIDEYDMTFTVETAFDLTPVQQFVLVDLDVLPRPHGVKSRFRVGQLKYFGFLGSAESWPFGEGRWLRINEPE